MRRNVRDNLFPPALPAVEPWDEFRWHLDRKGVCDTWKKHSSQALTIDVFGCLKVAPQRERDVVLNALARLLRLPESDGWSVELEWKDHCNRLKEKRETQVDAFARSPRSLIFFETKFTEKLIDYCCSQTKPYRGTIQCDGRYRLQTNPRNNKEDKCALSGKGIQYWEIIPKVFRYSKTAKYDPCPFSGIWFQWMRNCVLSWKVSADEKLKPAFLVVYADSPEFPFACEVKGSKMSEFVANLHSEVVAFRPISYQRAIRVAKEAVSAAGGNMRLWNRLSVWVNKKITCVAGRNKA
jgi:hypothetical protein